MKSLVLAARSGGAAPSLLALAALLGFPLGTLSCASAKAVPGATTSAGPAVPARSTPGIPIEDALHGARYVLPPIEGGWQTSREGSAELGGGIQVEIAGFPLAAPATGISCRDSARARLADAHQPGTGDEGDAPTGKPAPPPGEGLRDQQVEDAPIPSWSFTRGRPDASVRSRWAFYPRGSDCVLLEVTGPVQEPFGAQVFGVASQSLKLQPLSLERQRELDLLAGMGFLERREAEAALERFEALSAREPSFAKAHFGALMAAFDAGPPAYARGLPHGEAVLRAERELSSEQRLIALRAMGVIQLSQNKLTGAASTLSELVVRAPELAEGHYNLGCVLARLGDTPGALRHLKTAVVLDPSLANHAREDEDLVSLRGSPVFEEMLIAADAR